jgi:hypothetical protein
MRGDRATNRVARRVPVIEFVMFKAALVLPLPAVQLAWALEDRGLRLSVDRFNGIVIQPSAGLTKADLAGVRRWRHHLAAIVTYITRTSDTGR